MNYLKVYCNLIRKAENRTPFEGYVEKHHTFPKSIFGNNSRVVVLTAREHYIAHALLEKICIKRYGLNHWKTQKMIYAFWGMNNQQNNLQKRYFNSKLYEGVKIRVNLIAKQFKHAEKSKQQISKSLKNLGDNHPARSNENWIKKKKEYMKQNNPMNNLEYVKKLCKFTYEIVSPDGQVFVVDNMNDFCRKHNLDSGSLSRVINGKPRYKSHKGWTGKKLSHSPNLG